jgi:TolB-like protein/DNA-binding winged helix-turn-helix (wHTH) protein
MTPEKTVPPDLVLDLASFQLIRAGLRVKLEKTPMELLTLLVHSRGALVSREEIVRTIWGDAVHVDVDAGINTAIRKIRQALDDHSASPRYLETVVGKGYRFIGAITVVENAAESKSGALPAQGASAPRTWVRVALAAAGLAAVLILAIYAIHRDPPAVSGNSQGRLVIAVTPLQNLSEDPGQDYLVDGLTDEILTQLGQLNPERLGVVRYRSSTTKPTTMSSTADLDQRSGLQYVLEGSVRRHLEQARISIRLVRVADETTLWTDSFDRQVGDVLSLQSEIAQRIGRELQIHVLGRAKHKPARPEVVEAHLRGQFEMSRRYEMGRRYPPDAARVFFERAIALDPSYAPAHVGLADFYRARAVGDDDGAEQAWRLAGQYATHALSLDPESAETHAAIAEIKLIHDWDWHAAREHALRALQLNPSSPEAHTVYARYLRIMGNTGDAVNQHKQAIALDPVRPDLKVELLFEYFFSHDYESGVDLARELLPYDPDTAHSALCIDLGYLKHFDEAVPECTQALALDGHNDWVPGFLQEYRQRGYAAAMAFIARQDLKEIRQRLQPDLWELANAYVSAGMREQTFGVLFQGVQIHEPGLLQIRVDPDFDSIRSDPRYAELVRQIGFPTE